METLRGPDDLTGRLREALPLAPGPPPATAVVLMSARRLGEAVDRAVLAVADDRLPTYGDVTLLNRSAAAAPRPAVQLVTTKDRLQPVGNPTLAPALIAQDAVGLLLSAEMRRVCACGADRCALRTLDRSPARNRRWCSMSRCGNRSKVRLHQARVRESGPTTEN